MSKRLDILGAHIFGASVCHARKYLQPFRKCPNVWTKSSILAIMHKRKPHIIRTKACICAFCYFIDFLHTFLDIFIENTRFFQRFSHGIYKVSAFHPMRMIYAQDTHEKGRLPPLRFHLPFSPLFRLVMNFFSFLKRIYLKETGKSPSNLIFR